MSGSWALRGDLDEQEHINDLRVLSDTEDPAWIAEYLVGKPLYVCQVSNVETSNSCILDM